MDIEEVILALRANPRDIVTFVQAVARLFNLLADSHAVFRGTHEAVLAEAQGAQIFDAAGQVFGHLNSLIQGRTALANRDAEIDRGLNFMARFSSNLSAKAREIVTPLLRESARQQSLIAETEARAAELARTFPTRLQGARIGAGGLGPEVIRNEASLVSTQLEAQAVQLRAQGIQPTVLPNPEQAADYLRRVRSLAVNNQDSLKRIVPILTAMRLAIRQALSQASIAGRALLSTVLDALGAALDVLAARLGGMLVTPLIIPKSILESLQVERADSA